MFQRSFVSQFMEALAATLLFRWLIPAMASERTSTKQDRISGAIKLSAKVEGERSILLQN
jgi:hypothetical protein